MLPLLPLVVVGLTGAAAYKVHKKKTTLSPAQKMVLDTALSSKLVSADYLKLADAFDQQGLKAEATLLRNRAALQDAPPDKKLAWRNAFKKAMSQEDPKLVDKMAAAFQQQGATGAAADLRKYAQGLRDGTASPSPAPASTSGTGGPSIMTTPPLVVPTPAATQTAIAASTTTPTVTNTTGATVTQGNPNDPMAQGAPPVASLPIQTPAVAPGTVASIAGLSPDNAKLAASLDAQLQAATQPSVTAAIASVQASSPATAAGAAGATTATPTVAANVGSANTGPTDLTTPMGQGTPQ